MAGYIQRGSGLIIPASFAETAPAGEVATTRDGRDITRGYVDPMVLLLPQDEILLARGAGNQALYREVLRDDQVASVLQQRRRAVVSAEWEVQPGGAKRQDKAAADALRDWLTGVNLGLDDDQHARLPQPGWDAVTDKMLFGLFYGYAVAECLWGRDGRHITLDAVRVRDRRRFAFDGAMRLRLRTMSKPEGELLPPRKFWAFATGADHDDEPYGLGLAHWLYWPVLFKRQNLKFWLIFLEKFGQPTVTGKYASNAGPLERQRLLQAVEAVRTDTGVIIPEGMALELLEAARSGTADYTALFDRMNAAITKVVLGHTGTSDSTPGKLGSEDMAQDVREDVIKADADLVCDSFNRGPARWLTQWNYPNAAAPRVWRRTEQPEDLNAVAERDKTIVDMGFRPSLRHVTDTYGGEWTERAPCVPDGPPTGAQPGRSAEFAEDAPDAPDMPELQAERLDQELGPATDAWIDELRARVEAAESLQALRDELLEAYPGMEPERFAAVMREALASAQLAGRYDILDET
jgi:phage gp29-like protein